MAHKVLSDGTHVQYCHPHRRWEWDCECGGVNSTQSKACQDCGEDRKKTGIKGEGDNA